MKLERLEALWVRMCLGMLVAFFAIVMIDAGTTVRGAPFGSETVDAAKLRQTAPFSNPGIFRRDGTHLHVSVVAYAFGFRPSSLTVPEGSKVTFHLTSEDVVHSYTIPGRTNVNALLLPGHVTKVTQRFDDPGSYLVLCNEYCGAGHQHMTMHITVAEGKR